MKTTRLASLAHDQQPIREPQGSRPWRMTNKSCIQFWRKIEANELKNNRFSTMTIRSKQQMRILQSNFRSTAIRFEHDIFLEIPKEKISFFNVLKANQIGPEFIKFTHEFIRLT